MAKLKLGPLTEDKPVKVTVELPGQLHRDLTAYAEVLAPKLASPLPIPSGSSCRCWNASSNRSRVRKGAARERQGTVIERGLRYRRIVLFLR